MISKTTQYLRSAKDELQKITWPSRKDTWKYTWMVIGISVCTMIFMMGLDYAFSSLIAYLLTITS